MAGVRVGGAAPHHLRHPGLLEVCRGLAPPPPPGKKTPGGPPPPPCVGGEEKTLLPRPLTGEVDRRSLAPRRRGRKAARRVPDLRAARGRRCVRDDASGVGRSLAASRGWGRGALPSPPASPRTSGGMPRPCAPSTPRQENAGRSPSPAIRGRRRKDSPPPSSYGGGGSALFLAPRRRGRKAARRVPDLRAARGRRSVRDDASGVGVRLRRRGVGGGGRLPHHLRHPGLLEVCRGLAPPPPPGKKTPGGPPPPPCVGGEEKSLLPRPLTGEVDRRSLAPRRRGRKAARRVPDLRAARGRRCVRDDASGVGRSLAASRGWGRGALASPPASPRTSGGMPRLCAPSTPRQENAGRSPSPAMRGRRRKDSPPPSSYGGGGSALSRAETEGAQSRTPGPGSSRRKRAALRAG